MSAQLIGVNDPYLPSASSNESWVVVDSNVDDLQTLVSAAVAYNRVFMLDQDRDGVEQITQLLQSTNASPSKLHVISHGSPGTLYLGNSELSLRTLDQYLALLKTWSIHDLYLYGCNVALGDAGEEFLQKLHTVTQANIVAASHKVGSSDAGGSWCLNYKLGEIESPAWVTPALVNQYSGVFNELTRIYTVTEDNADNDGNRTPDGDFGRGIRVGANGARNVDTGEDLGQIQPIDFYFDTTIEATIGSALLFLSVFDVDATAANPEENLVTFNGTELGLLEGRNELSVKTLFRLDNSLVELGPNFVQIDVNIQNYSENWEAEIEKAELLINYIVGETVPGGTAFLDTIGTDTSSYQGGDTVQFFADIDTTLTPSQTLEVEAILRNPSREAVDFDDRVNFLISGDSDEDEFTWNVGLPDNAVDGIWQIDIAVFDAATDEFQFLASQPFAVGNVPPPSIFLDTIGTDRDNYNLGETVIFSADIDTSLDQNQVIDAGAILRDPDGNIVATENRPDFLLFGAADNDAFVWDFGLPGDAAPGDWSVEIGSFDDAGNFQPLGSTTFSVGVVSPVFPPSGPLVFQFEDYVRYEELDEGRPYIPPDVDFNERLYLLANPDVLAAVKAGIVGSGAEHFALFGANEGRIPYLSFLDIELTGSGLRLASLVDETYYLFENPDVAEEVDLGIFEFGIDHFIEYGIFEGRNPSFYYDEDFYLANNEDVRLAIENTDLVSGLQHYLLFGHRENRNPSSLFNANEYLAQNPDVAFAVDNGFFDSAFDHYIEFGASEGRLNTLLYEESYYISTNPDVAAAVEAGDYETGFDHYIIFGQKEGRDPSASFSEITYLEGSPDVITAVENGGFSSGMEHFFRFGRQEGRPAFGPIA